MKAYYHLPGLFEFYELYKEFLPLYRKHREYFYDWCDIGSIYGAPADCVWGGGRVGFGEHDPKEVLKLMQEYGISARLTFSNSLLTKEHLSDKKCNELCRIFDIGRDNERSRGFGNGIIIYSDILLDYIKENYPDFYFISSTTKVLTDFCEFEKELNRKDFRYVVPDFRLNKSFDKLKELSQHQKDKVEFLCNECCWFGCTDRKKCYETVSRKNLGEDCPEHYCTAPDAVQVKTGMDVFEIVGTGGDNAQSFNISTTSALVAAAGGMKVAKHGNRAASSLCGTADCLEALGVNIDQSPEKCVELLNKVGMCFFFAQKYHTSMKYVGPIRKELGFRTVFNILGPLTNPGSPAMQLLGVYDEYLVEPLAQVLVSLGVKRGMVVYGMDKLDEISMSASTKICEIKDGWFRTTVISPEDFGFERCTKEDLKGGTPEENAKIVRDILGGQKGNKRNAVLMNAGASLYIGGKADSMKEGIELAAEIIDSGKALETLDKLIEVSNS